MGAWGTSLYSNDTKLLDENNEINYSVNDGVVVIGIRYDEFNLNGNSDQEWDNVHNEQINYLNEIIEEIEKMFKDKVKVLKYNQYSVYI